MVNCNENAYITNYRKMGKPIEYKRNNNERVNISTFPPIVSHDEIGDEEELPIQPISSIRSLKKLIKPTHDVVKKKKKKERIEVKRYLSQIMLLLLLLCLMKVNQ